MRRYNVANAGAIAGASARGISVRRGAPRSPGSGSWPGTLALAVAGVAGLAVTAVTVALTAQAAPHNQLAALGQGVVVTVPLVVGLYACRRGPYPLFASLLLIAALAWSLIGLAESTNSLLYSIGRITEWLVEPLVVYLVLTFPSGRLNTSRERAIVLVAVAIVAVLFLPTALVVATYPVPVPWTSCGAGCPHNAFMISASQPAFVSGIIEPAREVAAQLVFLVTVGILAGRLRGASRLTRRAQGALLTVAIIRFLSMTAYLIMRRAGMHGALLDVLGWIWLLTLPGIAVAFLAGILRWRLFTADALQRLTLARVNPGSGSGPRADPGSGDALRHSLAVALDDPSLRVLYQTDADNRTWVTESGEPAKLPAPGSGLDATAINGPGGRVLAIVHDEALNENRPLVAAAATHMVVELENQALQAQVRRSLRELAQSRAQALAAGESARRKIRQNLHDGAQQRLVALLVRLELAGPQIERDPARGSRVVAGLADEVEQTLADIRVLSHGLEPTLLTEEGLVKALAATVANAPLHTALDADGARRYPPEVEACAYFVCMEALSNAYKHAADATNISISVRDTDGLIFAVSDDGAGFDPGTVRPGLGMASMRERLASVGGRMALDSAPGRGTRLTGTIPLRYDRRGRAPARI